jgi:hypothetical protein
MVLSAHARDVARHMREDPSRVYGLDELTRATQQSRAIASEALAELDESGLLEPRMTHRSMRGERGVSIDKAMLSSDRLDSLDQYLDD